jgi:hypothetical protein
VAFAIRQVSITGQENVLGLDVAMHYVVGMRVRQRASNFASDPKRVVEAELPIAIEPAPQRLAFHVGHHVEEGAAGVSGVVQRQNVGMLQARGRVDFAQESLGSHRFSKECRTLIATARWCFRSRAR